MADSINTDLTQQHQKLITLVTVLSDILDKMKNDAPDGPYASIFEKLSLLSKQFLTIFELIAKDKYAVFLTEFHERYQKKINEIGQDNTPMQQFIFLVENLMLDSTDDNIFYAYAHNMASTYVNDPIHEMFDVFKIIMMSSIILASISLIPLMIVGSGFWWAPMVITVGIFLLGMLVIEISALTMLQKASVHLKPFNTSIKSAQESARNLYDALPEAMKKCMPPPKEDDIPFHFSANKVKTFFMIINEHDKPLQPDESIQSHINDQLIQKMG